MFEETNEELLRKYQKGNFKAFKIFYDRNSKLIYYYLMIRLRSQSVAEDLLQESFLKMHKNIMRYDPSKKALPWLFTITRNTLIDYVRKSKEISHENMDIFSEETAENFEQKEELEEILGALPLEERKLIEDRFLKDKSYEEIAAQNYSSLSATRKRVSRILEKLRLSFARSR